MMSGNRLLISVGTTTSELITSPGAEGPSSVSHICNAVRHANCSWPSGVDDIGVDDMRNEICGREEGTTNKKHKV
jgi:hypothetical protein